MKKMKAKKDRYRVDTYVEDGIYNDRFIVTSYHPSLKEARTEAIKEEKYQKRFSDHSMVHIDSAISSNRKKFRAKKQAKDAITYKSNSSYAKGKRWGFAVMRAATQTSKAAVMKADKAMQTCDRYAKTGYKCNRVKLTKEECAGYKGVADGMYEYVRKNSR